MVIYEHTNPIDDPPSTATVERHLESSTPEDFVEWVLERKGKATREYFMERWGLAKVDVENAASALERRGVINIRT